MVVRRVSYVRSSHRGRDALEQRFEFHGHDAASLTEVIRTAPLVGEGSLLGDRPGEEHSTDDRSRRVRAFSPAPGFRFDVDITPGEGHFVVRFSQPDLAVPYLQGDLLWSISDGAKGSNLDEQINTERALRVVAEPLGGPAPSLRRWLFFRIGHKQVMRQAVRNIAELLDRSTN